MCGPVGRKLRSQPHQALGIELWWLPTVDDRRGDIRREPAQAQYDIKVVRCNSLLVSDVMHGQGCVFGEAPLNVIGARDDSQEAHIG